jgi:hypothetical protein
MGKYSEKRILCINVKRRQGTERPVVTLWGAEQRFFRPG